MRVNGTIKSNGPQTKKVGNLAGVRIGHLGVEMHYNTRVGRDIQVTDLVKQYDAVYLSAGCYVSNALTGPDNKVIPGATLKGVEDGKDIHSQSVVDEYYAAQQAKKVQNEQQINQETSSS